MVSKELYEADEEKGREDITRTYPDDKDKVIAFLMDVIDHADKNYKEDDTGIKIRIDGLVMTIDELIATAMSDALKAIFSCLFVFLYLNFHTQSCMISCLGMGIIVLSFPFTAIITNGILQIKYFGVLQVMIIYIVLGIAADDIFVFWDAY